METKEDILQQFCDNMSRRFFGITVSEAHSKRICIDCKQPVILESYSHMQIWEYDFSALCKTCIDELKEATNV